MWVDACRVEGSMLAAGDSVEVELRVGMLDLALAKLMSADHHTIEFPTLLLPENVKAGSIIRLQCTRGIDAEIADRERFETVQQQILDLFATNLPSEPVLRTRNITQMSVVLAWDQINPASAELHSMALYKDGQRLGLIPQPQKRTVTKVSNLEMDKEYKFKLVLSTSAGDFSSNELSVKTHKMNDLSGIVACVGSLAHAPNAEAEIAASLERMGCHEPQTTVKLDTTHFICATKGGSEFQRAYDLNIPIVTPEWLAACEREQQLVSVSKYYLSAAPVPRPQQSASGQPAQPAEEKDHQSVEEAEDDRVSYNPASVKSVKSLDIDERHEQEEYEQEQYEPENEEYELDQEDHEPEQEEIDQEYESEQEPEQEYEQQSEQQEDYKHEEEAGLGSEAEEAEAEAEEPAIGELELKEHNELEAEPEIEPVLDSKESVLGESPPSEPAVLDAVFGEEPGLGKPDVFGEELVMEELGEAAVFGATEDDVPEAEVDLKEEPVEDPAEDLADDLADEKEDPADEPAEEPAEAAGSTDGSKSKKRNKKKNKRN